jgi:hypothetical protein
MAAQSVRFFTGTSKTWAKTLLATLFKGQSHWSLMPYDSTNGVTWADLNFTGADEFFTLKDSFQLSKADPTVTEIKIDQMDSTIDTSTEDGEWTFTGNIPVIAAAYCDIFFDTGATVTSSNKILGQDGTQYTAQAYFATPKEVYVTMMIENQAGTEGIAFARAKITVGVSNDDSTNPAYLKINGTILNNTESTGNQGDWAICSKITA